MWRRSCRVTGYWPRNRVKKLREYPSMQDYHQLDIWQRAMTYAVQVYEFTAQLPESERYNLTAHCGRRRHRSR